MTEDSADPTTAGEPGRSGSDQPTRTYETDAVTVVWQAARCIHTGRCLHALPSVFDTSRRPWIELRGADAAAVAGAVMTCPTGALSYSADDPTVPGEELAGPVTVDVRPNGPYYLRGDVTLRGPDGAVLGEHEPRLALCRCGATGNAPYCDNSHRAVDFHDTPRATQDGTLPADVSGARVEATDGGPYVLEGAVRVVTSGGRVLAETGSTALCRCGRSGSKPFCDGSHARAR